MRVKVARRKSTYDLPIDPFLYITALGRYYLSSTENERYITVSAKVRDAVPTKALVPPTSVSLLLPPADCSRNNYQDS